MKLIYTLKGKQSVFLRERNERIYWSGKNRLKTLQYVIQATERIKTFERNRNNVKTEKALVPSNVFLKM